MIISEMSLFTWLGATRRNGPPPDPDPNFKMLSKNPLDPLACFGTFRSQLKTRLKLSIWGTKCARNCGSASFQVQ